MVYEHERHPKEYQRCMERSRFPYTTEWAACKDIALKCNYIMCPEMEEDFCAPIKRKSSSPDADSIERGRTMKTL